jgi:hypothetical protein
MRRLVDDGQVVEVLADLDPAGVGVIDPGIPLEQRCVDLGHDQLAGHRPGQPDQLVELGQAALQTIFDPVEPHAVLGPGADGDLFAGRNGQGLAAQPRGPVRVDGRIPVDGVADPVRAEQGLATLVRHGQRIAGQARLERVGQDDPDRGPVAVDPGVERGEGRSDPDVALRAGLAARQVVGHPDPGGLAEMELGPEGQRELDGALPGVGSRGQRLAVLGGPGADCLGLQGEVDPAEEIVGDDVARGGRRAGVAGGDVDHDADEPVLGQQRVGRGRPDIDAIIGRGHDRRDAGHRREDHQQAERSDEGQAASQAQMAHPTSDR